MGKNHRKQRVPRNVKGSMSDKNESNRSAGPEAKMLRVDCDTSQDPERSLTGPTSSQEPELEPATDCDAEDLQVATKFFEPCKTNGLKEKLHKEEEENKSPLMSPSSSYRDEEDALAANDRKSCNLTNGDVCPNPGNSSSSQSSKQQLSPGDKLRFKAEMTGEWNCPVCDTKLDSQHSFTVHIRTHNPTDHSHTCSICQKTLSSASSLDRHMLIHSGERPFKCRICNMAFTTNGNMHRHMRTHSSSDLVETDSDPNNNQLAGRKKTPARSALKRTKSPPPGPSPKRHAEGGEDSSTSSEATKEEDMRLTDTCRNCGETTTSLAQHRCRSAALFDGISGPKFGLTPPVGFYDLTFTDFSSNKFSLIAKSFCEHNLRKSSSPYHDFQCKKCKRAFPCNSALALHQSRNCSDTYCEVCRVDLDSTASLLRHQVKHRLEGTLPFNGLSSPYTVKNHPFMGDFKTPSSSSDKEGFMAMLKLHNRDGKPFFPDTVANFAEDVFENPAYFVHGKPPSPAKASVFQRQFHTTAAEGETSKTDLADIQSIISVTSTGNHLRNIRSSPMAASPASPLEAGAVGPTKPSSSATEVPQHEIIPTQDSADSETEHLYADEKNDDDTPSTSENKDELSSTDNVFRCPLCEMKFRSENALKRHVRGHTQNGHSYACEECSYTSLDKSTLVRHQRTHNGERPYQCLICKYAFTTKANCERHVKKRHKKTSEAELRLVITYNSEPSLNSISNLTIQNINRHNGIDNEFNGRANYHTSMETVCKICNVDFRFNSVLQQHMHSIHNFKVGKPYMCALCSDSFSNKKSAVGHVVQLHPEVADKDSCIIINGAAQSNIGTEVSDSEATNEQSYSEAYELNRSRASSVRSDHVTAVIPEKKLAPPKTPQNLSLAALCQVAGDAAAVSACEPLNLVKNNDKANSQLVNNADDQPFDLSKRSGPRREQPLDLAPQALDLSIKSKRSTAFNKEMVQPVETKKPDPAVRSAASTLLALQSLAPRRNMFMPMSHSLFNPNLLSPGAVSMASSSAFSKESTSTAAAAVTDAIAEKMYKLSGSVSGMKARNPVQLKHERNFSCLHCDAGFTLKSNMERHIKRKHPLFAKPPRSRGSAGKSTKSDAPTTSISNSQSILSKPNNPTTLSSTTRAALRDVLNSKALGFSGSSLDHSLDLSRPESPTDSIESANDNRNTDDGASSGSNSGRGTQEEEGTGDLASVSSLIDNTAYSSNTLKQYFDAAEDRDEDKELSQPIRPDSNADTDEESTNKRDGQSSSNSGSEDVRRTKRSAYADSPNSVACPYCARKFPWSSSLRRHILTHTGLKPFKCPRCPILFTTKSNCERHQVRKHGCDQKAVAEKAAIVVAPPPDAAKQFKCNLCFSFFATQGNLRKHYYLRHWTNTGRGPSLLKQRFKDDRNSKNDDSHAVQGTVTEKSSVITFRCHLCKKNESFSDRHQCLDHLQTCHPSDYQLLLSKGAIDKAATSETKAAVSLQYSSDTTNKIFCVFCPRAFNSDENLRRHMRVHIGDRPFKCNLCTRRFSLRNSLFRHYRTNHPEAPVPLRTKTAFKNGNLETTGNCMSFNNEAMTKERIPSIGTDNRTDEESNDGGDLIQNLLGIHDSKMLDEIMHSADSAARLLGVKDALDMAKRD